MIIFRICSLFSSPIIERNRILRFINGKKCLQKNLPLNELPNYYHVCQPKSSSPDYELRWDTMTTVHSALKIFDNCVPHIGTWRLSCYSWLKSEIHCKIHQNQTQEVISRENIARFVRNTFHTNRQLLRSSLYSFINIKRVSKSNRSDLMWNWKRFTIKERIYLQRKHYDESTGSSLRSSCRTTCELKLKLLTRDNWRISKRERTIEIRRNWLLKGLNLNEKRKTDTQCKMLLRRNYLKISERRTFTFTTEDENMRMRPGMCVCVCVREEAKNRERKEMVKCVFSAAVSFFISF